MMFPEMNQTKCVLWQKFAFYGSYNKFIIVYGNMKIYEAKKTMKMVYDIFAGSHKECVTRMDTEELMKGCVCPFYYLIVANIAILCMLHGHFIPALWGLKKRKYRIFYMHACCSDILWCNKSAFDFIKLFYQIRNSTVWLSKYIDNKQRVGFMMVSFLNIWIQQRLPI